MATDLIKSLHERRDVLHDELLKDPRFQEYDLIVQLLARHEVSVSEEYSHKLTAPRGVAVLASTPSYPLSEAVVKSTRAAPSAARPSFVGGGTAQQGGKSIPFQRTATGMAAIVKASADYLRRKGSRADSTEIQAALVRQGILNSSPGDRAKVTSYLGRSKRLFDNVRGEGYGLREWSIADVT